MFGVHSHIERKYADIDKVWSLHTPMDENWIA